MSITITTTLTDPSADDLALAARLYGAASGAPAAGGTATTPATPPAVDYFPADWTKAPYPSPAGSKMPGAPYLMDKSGNHWVLDTAHPTTPIAGFPATAGGYQVLLNGVVTDPIPSPLPSDGWAIQFFTLLVVGTDGILYGRIATGQWHTYTNGSWYNSGEPPLTPVASSGGTSGTLPAAPTPSAVAPGSSGTILAVGTGQTYATPADALAAAKDGDTIKFAPGTYAPFAVTKAVLIDGGGTVANPGTATAAFSGGAIIDGETIADPSGYPHQLGGVVPMVDCIIRGIEVRNIGLQETGAGLTSGIRNGAACNVTLDNVYVHDCQDGVGSGGFPATWKITNSLFRDCGIGDGGTHNIYLSGGVVSAELTNVTSIIPAASANANRATGKMGGGHALKSRANALKVTGGYYASPDASCIDIPDGTTTPALVSGATLFKDPSSIMHGVLGYAVESTKNGTAGCVVTGSTLDAECPNPFVQSGGGTVTIAGCTIPRPITGQGNVTGL